MSSARVKIDRDQGIVSAGGGQETSAVPTD